MLHVAMQVDLGFDWWKELFYITRFEHMLNIFSALN